MKSNEPQSIGQVIEMLPSAQYKVQIGDTVVRCHLAGRMKINKIRVSIGDRVQVLVSGEIGRITRRL